MGGARPRIGQHPGKDKSYLHPDAAGLQHGPLADGLRDGELADLIRVACKTPRQMYLANALCQTWESAALESKPDD